MSIRIYNEGLTGAAAAEASRTEQLSRSSGTGKSNAGHGAGGEDQVQISSLSEAITTAQSQRAAGVQRLAALYQSGGYQVDSANVSRALVSHALAAGGTESKP